MKDEETVVCQERGENFLNSRSWVSVDLQNVPGHFQHWVIIILSATWLGPVVHLIQELFTGINNTDMWRLQCLPIASPAHHHPPGWKNLWRNWLNMYDSVYSMRIASVITLQHYVTKCVLKDFLQCCPVLHNTYAATNSLYFSPPPVWKNLGGLVMTGWCVLSFTFTQWKGWNKFPPVTLNSAGPHMLSWGWEHPQWQCDTFVHKARHRTWKVQLLLFKHLSIFCQLFSFIHTVSQKNIF